MTEKDQLSTEPLNWSPAAWHERAVTEILATVRASGSHHAAVSKGIRDLVDIDGCLRADEGELLILLSEAVHEDSSPAERATKVATLAGRVEHPTEVAQVIIGVAVDSAKRAVGSSRADSARVVSADLGGAVSGARTGAAIGGLLGNALGGAVLGGLVGGAVASASAAKN